MERSPVVLHHESSWDSATGQIRGVFPIRRELGQSGSAGRVAPADAAGSYDEWPTASGGAWRAIAAESAAAIGLQEREVPCPHQRDRHAQAHRQGLGLFLARIRLLLVRGHLIVAGGNWLCIRDRERAFSVDGQNQQMSGLAKSLRRPTEGGDSGRATRNSDILLPIDKEGDG